MMVKEFLLKQNYGWKPIGCEWIVSSQQFSFQNKYTNMDVIVVTQIDTY
jgi:hypothetical protein